MRDHPLLVHFMAGNTAGAVSGVVLNQLTAIKYASWESERGGFLSTARSMWRQGGAAPFMKGIVPTVLRDTIFGGVFALSKEGCARALTEVRGKAREAAGQRRRGARPQDTEASAAAAIAISRWSDRHQGAIEFLSSLIAGALGTVASSPFNFVRNIKYGWPASDRPPTSAAILGGLRHDAAQRRRDEGLWRSLSFLQERLRIGWGTARVAVGMAVGYEIYEVVKAQLEQRSHAKEEAGVGVGVGVEGKRSDRLGGRSGVHGLAALPDSASPRPTGARHER